MTALAAACVALAVLSRPVRGRPRRRDGGTAPARRTRRRTWPRRGGAPPAAESLLERLDMVAAQVRAGAAPLDAWSAAADVLDAPAAADESVAPLAPRVVDPMADLERWAGRDASTRAAARSAVAAWRLAERTGAPLGDLLDSAGATLRAQRADRAAVEAAVAGPRATTRLLLALPVAGIGLGELIGAGPVHVLLLTSAGRVCLISGGALLLAGRLWMRHLVATVEALADPDGSPGRRGGAAA